MADYPLKGFKNGSDTYTIASPSRFITILTTISVSGSTANNYLSGKYPNLSNTNITTTQFFDSATGSLINDIDSSKTLADILPTAKGITFMIKAGSPINNFIFKGILGFTNTSNNIRVYNILDGINKDNTYGLSSIKLDLTKTFASKEYITLFTGTSTPAYYRFRGISISCSEPLDSISIDPSTAGTSTEYTDIMTTPVNMLNALLRLPTLPQGSFHYKDLNNNNFDEVADRAWLEITKSGSPYFYDIINITSDNTTNTVWTVAVKWHFPQSGKTVTYSFTVQNAQANSMIFSTPTLTVT